MSINDKDIKEALETLDEYDFTNDLKGWYWSGLLGYVEDIEENIVKKYKELESVLNNLSYDEIMQYFKEKYNLGFHEEIKYTVWLKTKK